MQTGSDIEIFLATPEGIPVSAIGKIGGTKEFPMPTKHGWVQEDNVAAEFNIPPASSAVEFADNIEKVLDDLKEIVEPQGFILDISASKEFPFEELSHPLAMIAGCEPDYDAWIAEINIPPEIHMSPLRSCGAHVHVSWDFNPHDNEERWKMIRAMDLTLGAPGLLLDEDNRRRELYGKAGACRPKMYGDIPGVEWRTSSNWWVKERKYMEWTFSGAQLALEMKDEIDWDKMEVLRQAINTGDRKTAEALIKYFKIPMP